MCGSNRRYSIDRPSSIRERSNRFPISKGSVPPWQGNLWSVFIVVALLWYSVLGFYVFLRTFQLCILPSHPVTRRMDERLFVGIGLGVLCLLPLLLRRHSMLKKVNLLTASAALCFAVITGVTDMSMDFGWGLVRSDMLAHSDAIIVLEGSTDVKFAYAAELRRQGYARNIVVFAPEEYASRLGKENGVPWIDVLALPPQSSTYAEALASRDIFQIHGWTKGILVTAPFHTLRAGRTFAKQGLDMTHAPIPDTLWQSDKRMEKYSLWQRLRVRHIWMIQVLHEYIGLLYYSVRSYI